MLLIIAEKPSAAKRIAQALSEDKIRVEKKRGVTIYHIIVNGEEAIVIPAAGHLYGLGEIDKSFDYPVFNITWKPLYMIDKKASHVKKFLDVLKEYSPKIDRVVVACDYDIEGELIGKNIVTLALNRSDAERMKFSTLTPYELKKSFKERMPSLDWPQARAGEARHMLDWLYGINLSRALMHSSKKSGQYKVLSIGRVQGPALKIIVDREKEIEEFKPEKYWELIARLEKNGEEIIAIHEKERFKDKIEVEKAKKNSEGEARVNEIRKAKKKIAPPPAFDLTSLQTEAYRLYKYSPAKTLSIAQKLYLAGLISYPRTSSQKLPKSIGYEKILKALSKKYREAERLIGRNPIQGKKTDPAHPAIYPTGIEPKKLSREEERIYDLISRRFLAAFSDPAERMSIEARIIVGKERYIAKGIITLTPGWMKIYPINMKESTLPDLERGDKLGVRAIEILEKETQPPKRYTQAGLVKELEKRNLGTKATRAAIVQTLYDRGYIKDDPIKPTILGKRVVEILEKHSGQILDEALTRHFEEEMEQIRQNKKRVEEVVTEAKEVLRDILRQFKEKESIIGRELVNAHREEEKHSRVLGTCPICKKGELVIKYSRKNKQRFIACTNYPECSFTCPLPQKGRITPLKKKCQYCGFPLIRIGTGRNAREYCVNPNCPGKENMKGLKEEILKENGQIYIKDRKCPRCGGTLLVKKGMYGSFIACENWPKCKYTENINGIVNKKQGKKHL